MKHRKMIWVITSFFVVITLTNCNKMDLQPTDQYTDENFWLSAANADLMVNMAYNQMYSADKMWDDEALSDNVFEGRSNTAQRVIRNGNADPSLGRFASEWEAAYGGLKTCHIYLDNIDRVPNIPASVKEQRKAEIRFIRAFLYFRLVNFYGNVPFFTEDISLSESRTLARTDKATVMAFIHQEFDAAMQLLPSKGNLSGADKARVTKGAACAMQARAYLYENNWQMVATYTDSLINHQDKFGSYSLFPNYAGLFTVANEYNSEVILDYGYLIDKKTWSKYYDAAPLSVGARLNAYAPLQELVDSYILLNGKTIDEDPSYNENNSYVNRDPRLAATVIYDGSQLQKPDGSMTTIRIRPGSGTPDTYVNASSNSTATGYYMKKYYDVQANATFQSGLNIIMIRYADVLLMNAEAKFELGMMDASVWNQTIRAIRSRAGFTDAGALDYPAGLPTAQMRRLIRNERRSELALEGLRYFDIVRWKAGPEFLSGTVHGAKFANNNTSYIVLDTRKFDEGRDYLWSVPRSEIDLNNNLLPNNSGYGN
ncbi:RagB/SusD family nutrient uptake outer membrane protein [Niabella insulamsoli]|uniref:RagB/SusD family nutrient uptake outer membrane protein n=1 Tax=Niabella insulamsoli TaxID=3144874 RepID=UPI0031FDD61A